MAEARNADREFDIVLFGATGFTGGLTAEYLAAHAPAGLRWALAGRNPDKLERVRDRLADLDPELKRLPLLHADVTDPASLARRGRARPGGDHHRRALHARSVNRWSRRAPRPAPTTSTSPASRSSSTGCTSPTTPALRTGARLVHACGFDSIPHDLGASSPSSSCPRTGR